MNPAIKDAFEREFPVPDCLYFNEVEGDYWVREDRNRNEPSAEIGSRYNGRWATWQKCWDAGAGERRDVIASITDAEIYATLFERSDTLERIGHSEEILQAVREVLALAAAKE